MRDFFVLTDGRYYISLWIILQTLVYMQVIPHRKRYVPKAMLGGLLLLFVCRGILWIQSYYISVPLATKTMMALVLWAFAIVCCEIQAGQALYMVLWSLITQQTLQNASGVLLNLLWDYGIRISYPLYLLIWLAATLPAVYYLLAVPLFKNAYVVGRRHLLLAGVLFVEFELVQGIPDIKITSAGLGQNYQFVLMNGICLLVALYLVHTLFVKHLAENELTMAYALQKSQRERYEVAKRNVALINHHCHILKVQLSELRAAKTASEQQQCLDRLSDAVDNYDSFFDTNSDVLNMVLTEQSLYGRENGIRIHCVADGTQLEFISPADLYVLCTNVIQHTMENAKALQNPAMRQIDIAVYRRQGLAIIETASLLNETSVSENKTEDSFTQENVRMILQKYKAEMFVGNEHGTQVLRCLIPIQKQ